LVTKTFQFISAVLLLFIFCVGGVLLKWTPLSPSNRRWVRIYFTHYLARILAWCIRLEIKTQGESERNIGKLIVANHTSVLDAIVLAARSPCVFVTSVEIEENPVLEFLARTGGAIFIERRCRDRVEFDQSQIRQLLVQRFDVVLFPEGTSTDGTAVRRFKTGLFPAATESRAPIEPVCIYFELIDGQPVDEKNRDRIYYYGDHLMSSHLFRIFTNGRVKVHVQSLGETGTKPQEDAKEVASICREQILGALTALSMSHGLDPRVVDASM